MGKFIVEPHFRLQEWVAEEKGYFRAEGLDYEFRELIRSTAGQHHNKGASGAFQSIEKGREADVSCACHWTVAVAASNGHARLYADAYSVAPAGIFVPADSPIRTPADLAGVTISVGFQSGSHYSTIHALEQYLPRDQIKLTGAGYDKGYFIEPAIFSSVTGWPTARYRAIGSAVTRTRRKPRCSRRSSASRRSPRAARIPAANIRE